MFFPAMRRSLICFGSAGAFLTTLPAEAGAAPSPKEEAGEPFALRLEEIGLQLVDALELPPQEARAFRSPLGPLSPTDCPSQLRTILSGPAHRSPARSACPAIRHPGPQTPHPHAVHVTSLLAPRHSPPSPLSDARSPGLAAHPVGIGC